MREQASEELRKCLKDLCGWNTMKLVEHQPYLFRRWKIRPGIDLSGIIQQNWWPQEASSFSRYPKQIQHFGVFWPTSELRSENAVGTAHITKIKHARMLTEAENAPLTVTTLVTNGEPEETKTFWWVHETAHAGLWKALWENTHGHNYFPHLVMKLQDIVQWLPIAYYPSDLEVHVKSLGHEAFTKMVGLRRAFLLLHWAKLADKKWLVTRQDDGTDYYFPLYLTRPEALRNFLKS